MSDIDDIRGKQVTVGGFTFVMPTTIPDTDEEVIEREELIAAVLRASKPARSEAELSKAIVRALRSDIDESFEERDRRERSGETQESMFRRPQASVTFEAKDAPALKKAAKQLRGKP